MKALLKWAGGKDRELRFIIPKSPKKINNYYEPFFGGGAVYFSIEMVNGSCFVNDASNELIDFYLSVKESNQFFFKSLEKINNEWILITKLFNYISNEILTTYSCYKSKNISDSQAEKVILDWVFFFSQKFDINNLRISIFKNAIYKSFKNKFKRTQKLELKKGTLAKRDIKKIFLSAVKSGYYTFIRTLYNNPKTYNVSKNEYSAIFLFVRNFCYSGMFRYNTKGEFNVPYGGIGYNNNNLTKKITYYKSRDLIDKFRSTQFENLDFVDFLDSKDLTRNDFVFLDPPYDSEFSTYAQKEFNRSDHKRLADYLKKKIKAKWMLVIKSTEFILDLYQSDNFIIEAVDKKYNVSFMERNNREVTHLIIRNYE